MTLSICFIRSMAKIETAISLKHKQLTHTDQSKPSEVSYAKVLIQF